ncbi:hypothetical protein JN531_017230 (plasmid) [Flagellatimonas centrodinii]|uniref:hypothetical protein n=1 Tax=Flagellatimonas centrodinii TaxID=2806210 RepID=UPI001FED8235|nr:hypothetical protein [Flagellatimonas centrodinii]ULQ48376.1 hypothetical protein JN531_017230 [Flagellatimonas centrodinii]
MQVDTSSTSSAGPAQSQEYFTHTAAELLVLAYARAERSGSVDWEDLNVAHRAALSELGGKRSSQLVELAADAG